VSTGVTRVDVATQSRRAARQDAVDDRALLPAPSRTARTAVLGLRSRWSPVPQVPLEDLRDLVPRSLGHLPGGNELRS
jgi:hypothetical protein